MSKLIVLGGKLACRINDIKRIEITEGRMNVYLDSYDSAGGREHKKIEITKSIQDEFIPIISQLHQLGYDHKFAYIASPKIGLALIVKEIDFVRAEMFEDTKSIRVYTRGYASSLFEYDFNSAVDYDGKTEEEQKAYNTFNDATLALYGLGGYVSHG